jgi:glycerate kinase
MSSQEANEACAKGLRAQHDDVEINQIEASDGGEGFLRAMRPDRVEHCHVHDAMMRWTDADFGIKDGKAIIEVAQAVGLDKIEPELRNPLVATSYGVGELMVHAWEQGCREFVVGLGGSATSDCGLGMLRCLRHHAQQRLHQMWYDPLRHLSAEVGSRDACLRCRQSAHRSARRRPCLCTTEGSRRTASGTSRTPCGYFRYDGCQTSGLRYEPADPAPVLPVDWAMPSCSSWTPRWRAVQNRCCVAIGFDTTCCRQADLVITGEGASDAQTLMGKLPSIVLRSCAEGRSAGRSCQWARRGPGRITRCVGFSQSSVYQRRTIGRRESARQGGGQEKTGKRCRKTHSLVSHEERFVRSEFFT